MAASALFSSEQIVGAQSDTKLPLRQSRPSIYGPRELEGVHQLRRYSPQIFTLANGFSNQPDFAALEIPDAAVHQSRRFARCSTRPVVLLDERDTHAPHRHGA